MLEPNKNFIFSCSYCSCTIFIYILYSLYTPVMLILILIDVQYLQSVDSSFKKGSNGQNHSSSGSHHLINRSPQQNFIPPPLNAIWKTLNLFLNCLFIKLLHGNTFTSSDRALMWYGSKPQHPPI